MKTRMVLTLFSLAVFASCSQPRIDTSSDETMKKSIEQVRNSLPEAKREQFDKALQTIAFKDLTLPNIIQQGLSGITTFEASAKAALHGKTGLEVIEAAEQIEKERFEKEKAEALDEIKRLEDKKAAAERDRIELQKFKVTRAKFRKEKQSFLGDKVTFELTVVNNTSHPVSRAYFTGILASPGRAIPWIKDDFNYQISGGLEPGEKATWYLSPNMFSGWSTIDAPASAVFTVETIRLDGPDNKTLYSSEFSEGDQEKLDELRQKYIMDAPTGR